MVFSFFRFVNIDQLISEKYTIFNIRNNNKVIFNFKGPSQAPFNIIDVGEEEEIEAAQTAQPPKEAEEPQRAPSTGSKEEA